ncbi:MAG: hypothetical protein FJ117_20380 [Deltaproteobacteria bacterium]|nr:hypothetical protein [Deltaproteobacteria bacterium]
MKIRKKIIMLPVLFTAVGFILELLACPSTANASEKWLNLSWVGMHAKTEARMRLTQELVDLINEKAKGQIHIKFKGGPEVIPIAQQGTAVSKGVVFMSQLASASFESLVPSGPMVMVSDISHKEEKLGGAYDIWREAYAKAGLYFLGRSDARNKRSFYLGFRKSVSSVLDLKGKSMSGSTVWGKAMAEALGMSFSVVKSGEAYTALDTGVFDGFGTTPPIWIAWSMYEAVKYFIDHPIFYTNMVIILNLKTFNEFPKPLQKIIHDAYDEMEPKFTSEMQKEVDKCYEIMRKTMTPIKFSPGDEKLFIETAYRAQLKRSLAEAPIYGPKLVKPLGLEKYLEK